MPPTIKAAKQKKMSHLRSDERFDGVNEEEEKTEEVLVEASKNDDDGRDVEFGGGHGEFSDRNMKGPSGSSTSTKKKPPSPNNNATSSSSPPFVPSASSIKRTAEEESKNNNEEGDAGSIKTVYKIGCAVWVLSMIVLIVVLAVFLSGGDSSDTEAEDTIPAVSAPSASPPSLPPQAPTTTLPPSPSNPDDSDLVTSPPTELGILTLEEYLISLEISNPEDLQMEGTPQYRALNWLLDEDEFMNYASMSLTPKEYNPRVVERYTLVVVYYAFGGPTNWTYPLNFLDPSSDVCAWNQFFVYPSGELLQLGARCNNTETATADEGTTMTTNSTPAPTEIHSPVILLDLCEYAFFGPVSRFGVLLCLKERHKFSPLKKNFFLILLSCSCLKI